MIQSRVGVNDAHSCGVPTASARALCSSPSPSIIVRFLVSKLGGIGCSRRMLTAHPTPRSLNHKRNTFRVFASDRPTTATRKYRYSARENRILTSTIATACAAFNTSREGCVRCSDGRMGSTIVSDSAKARSTKLALTSEGSTISEPVSETTTLPARLVCGPFTFCCTYSVAMAVAMSLHWSKRHGAKWRGAGRETASALTRAIAPIDCSRSTMGRCRRHPVRHRRESDLGRGGAMQQDKLRMGNASLRAKSDPPENHTMSRAHPLVMPPTGATAGGAPVGAPE